MNATSPKSPGPSQNRIHPAARLWAVGVGLALAAGGAFFCWALWFAYQRASETDLWVETPCQIVVSAVAEAEGKDQYEREQYEFLVRYHYVFEGTPYNSERVKYSPSGPILASDREKIEKWVKRFPPGMETACYVNPDTPAEAVLKKNTKAPLYTLWFPLLFVAAGLGIAVSSLLRGRKGQRA